MTHLFNDRAPSEFEFSSELLASIPFQFGYQPENCLVVLSLVHEPDRVLVGIGGYFDLDVLAAEKGTAAPRRVSIAKFPQELRYDGYLVLYSDEYFRDLVGNDDGGPKDELDCSAITRELALWYDDPAFNPERTIIVGAAAWHCLKCPVPQHCPPSGRDLRELKETRYALQMLYDGHSYADRPDDLIDLPEFDGPPWQAEFVRLLTPKIALTDWGGELSAMWRKFIISDLPEPRPSDDLADLFRILSLSLHSIPVRDNVIYALCIGILPESFVDIDVDRFGEMFESTDPPARKHVHQALAKLESLARACDPAYRVPILTVWAWCHWWFGNVTMANLLVDKALAAAPEYSLAQTLRSVLFGRAVPPWLRAGFDERS